MDMRLIAPTGRPQSEMLRLSAGLLQPGELPAAHYMHQMYHPAYNSYMQQLQLHEQLARQRGIPPPHPAYQLPAKKETEEEGRATPAAAEYGAGWPVAGYHEQPAAPFSLESPCSRDIVELQR